MEIRRLRYPDELAHEVAIHNAVRPHDRISVDDARGFWDSHPRRELLLAWDDGDPVGVASASVEYGRAHLRLSVLREHRRAGIGSALFAEAAGWLVAEGAPEAEGRIDDAHAAAASSPSAAASGRLSTRSASCSRSTTSQRRRQTRRPASS